MLDPNLPQKAYCFSKNVHHISLTVNQYMSLFLLLLTAPYIKSLVTSLSSQRPRFNVWEVHLGFVVDKLHRRSLSPSISDCSRSVIVPPMLHTHFHHLTLRRPQHTMLAIQRSIHHTVTTVVPTTTDRPTANTAVRTTSLHVPHHKHCSLP